VRPALEVADIFRRHGPAYRLIHDGHLGRIERRVMSAIELCRTPALGGHVEACDDCDHSRIAYNSCRNRHCPKCQATARERWIAAREADLLPIPYFHVVFTVPAEIAVIAYQNKPQVYAILFDAVAETLKTIGADPKHLGGELGFIAILHTWGQTLTHHPHIHCLIPGGALSADGQRWIACRPRFFLPIPVLSLLFRRLFLERLKAAHSAGRLQFFGSLTDLSTKTTFDDALGPMRKKSWVVYAKPPFGSPAHVLAYLGRYTHRVAIANSRFVSIADGSVSFNWRDYRHGNAQKNMSLDADEFIRRFLLHSLPDGFHRIRHYGFLANGCRRARLATIRPLLAAAMPTATDNESAAPRRQFPDFNPTACPCCGGTLRIVTTLPRDPACRARAPPA
jgi:Putative transposase/Transposase zinc-binding domain